MSEKERVGLENLSPPDGARQRSRRVGRGPGSGSGKTSGRGHKGQKARSGGKLPPWFEGGQMPLYRRVPKRGFTPWDPKEIQVVNVESLDRLEEGEVTPEVLRAHGLIRSAEKAVKILGRGEVERAMTVRADAFSASARQKIEDAGGTADVLDRPSG